MIIKQVTRKLVDVFVDTQTYPTGFEPNCWLRLANRGTAKDPFCVQVAGIKVPAWQFKAISLALFK